MSISRRAVRFGVVALALAGILASPLGASRHSVAPEAAGHHERAAPVGVVPSDGSGIRWAPG